MAVLRNATISFHTNNEYKDSNTQITVSLFDPGNIVAARVFNDFEHLAMTRILDFSHWLTQIPAQKRHCQAEKCRSTSIIMDMTLGALIGSLRLMFSDGTRMSGGGNGLELMQDRKQQEFGIDGIMVEVPDMRM